MSLGRETGGAGDPRRTASVLVLTHNRRHLLKQCVENVLGRASSRSAEILIWNNASTDGTGEYLDSVEDPRITVIHHPENIGMNGYVRLFKRASGAYLIMVDDDVIDAPAAWDEALIGAFELIPDIGYLATNLARNPHDITSGVMYGMNAHLYRTEEIGGVRLKVGGPVGGWCSLISRDLYDALGGLAEQRDAFWQDDGALLDGIGELGYRGACLEDICVVHASGPYYSATPPEKLAYWRTYDRAVARKDAVKRVLLGVPGVRWLNGRYDWFHPPQERPDYVRLYSDPSAADAGGASS
jgi:GT2 family glycosyltransferase